MATASKTLLGLHNQLYVEHPDLINTIVYGVKRNGLGYDEVAGTPGNRQFQYDATNGRIIFQHGFSAVPITNIERVWVLYKTF